VLISSISILSYGLLAALIIAGGFWLFLRFHRPKTSLETIEVSEPSVSDALPPAGFKHDPAPSTPLVDDFPLTTAAPLTPPSPYASDLSGSRTPASKTADETLLPISAIGPLEHTLESVPVAASPDKDEKLSPALPESEPPLSYSTLVSLHTIQDDPISPAEQYNIIANTEAAILETAESPQLASPAPTTKVSPTPPTSIELAAIKIVPNASEDDAAFTRAPIYSPPKPVSPKVNPRSRNGDSRPRTPADRTDLHLHVQLAFDSRRGDVRTLALVPEHRDNMPEDVAVTGSQGELHLVALREECYEPVTIPDVGQALLAGVDWRGRGDARQWRWVLGGRELYVLAPGDESAFGLHGFISTTRLELNTRHVVLATVRLRDQILAALAAAGCATPLIKDDTIPGIPPGWLLFYNVTPTRSISRNEQDILNALCPAHEITPHFVGGIRLERNVWLAGFPPRIRFTGELVGGIQIKIDDQPALPAADGGFEAPNWATDGEHRLWFSDRAESYSLRPMIESWIDWSAHDFGIGATICGARTHLAADARWQQVRVTVTNPLLLGAHPGEVFYARPPSETRCAGFVALCPFSPVWSLPIDPAHADKKSARVRLFESIEPGHASKIPSSTSAAGRRWTTWLTAIRQAGCKGLSVDSDNAENTALWRRYRHFAKQLGRKMR
jgi:hypothetical protein